MNTLEIETDDKNIIHEQLDKIMEDLSGHMIQLKKLENGNYFMSVIRNGKEDSTG
jgi:hypothetical protein